MCEATSPGGTKILIAVVYRPPRLGYHNLFEDEIISLLPSDENIVIMGDLNADFTGNSNDAPEIKGKRAR